MQDKMFETLVDFMNQNGKMQVSLEQVQRLSNMILSDVQIHPEVLKGTRQELWIDPVQFSSISLESMQLLGMGIYLDSLQGLSYLTRERDYDLYLELLKKEYLPKWFSEEQVSYSILDDGSLDIVDTQVEVFARIMEKFRACGFSDLVGLFIIEKCCNYDDFTYGVEALGYRSLVDFLRTNRFLNDQMSPDHDLFIAKATPLFLKEAQQVFKKEASYGY